MGFFGKLIGLALMLLGVYLIAQNIIFQTRAVYGWRDIPAVTSVVALCLGVLTLIYGRGGSKAAGWILIAFGAIFVVFSGGVFLRPTSLWAFLLSLIAMASGFQLLTTGRVSL